MFHFRPSARLSYIMMLYSVRPIKKFEGSGFGQVLSSPLSKHPPNERDPFLDPVKRSTENQVSTYKVKKQ